MEYQALYRKYRPKTFDDVYGQEIIVRTLKNILSNNKLTPAYLFIGPRGTGKTSIAKIFAKSINCLNVKNGISCEKCDICINSNLNENVDIIEMDAASNNGVDEIREIKNHVTLLPTISKYKIYIIDEVHMLTPGAFNALLKTLEEPPKHIIFILATTEPHKIPLTIISRCQSFEFKPIPKNIIIERLKFICNEEKIEIDDESLNLIALDSNGGMRDAIGLLDQLNAYTNSNIKYDDVLKLNGRISNSDLKEILENLCNNKLQEAFCIADKIESEGKNFVYICEDIIRLLRNELINYQINKKSDFFDFLDKEKILQIILLINKTISDMKNSKDKRIFFDLMIININDCINNNRKENIKNNKQTNVCNIKVNSYENLIDNSVINKEKKDYKIYEDLMNIRLNNTLSCANKTSLSFYIEKFNNKNNEILNLDQLRILNIMSDFEIKAGSEDGIVFITNNQNLLHDVYNEILLVDNILSEIMNRQVKICILSSEMWNQKRQIYVNKIKNKENIDKIDESDIIKEISKKNSDYKSDEFEDLLEIGGE